MKFITTKVLIIIFLKKVIKIKNKYVKMMYLYKRNKSRRIYLLPEKAVLRAITYYRKFLTAIMRSFRVRFIIVCF